MARSTTDALCQVTYHEHTPPGFSGFFLTWAIFSAVVFGLGAFLLRPDLHAQRHQSGGDNADPYVGAKRCASLSLTPRRFMFWWAALVVWMGDVEI